VVQRYVLDKVKDPNLKVYVVWGPMLGGEKEEDAREATALVPDARAIHFWTAAHSLAEALRAPAGNELREAFNRDADTVRLVMLISPT